MKSTFNILFYVNKSLPSLLIRKQTSIFLWHSTEKCVLGYTLLWNQVVEFLVSIWTTVIY